MTRQLKPILVPEFVWLAEVEGEPVAFSLCVPDINVALKNQRPPDHFRPANRSGEIALSQEPAQNSAARGLGSVAEISAAWPRGNAGAAQYRGGDDQRGCSGEASLILENNVMMNRFLEAIGLEKYKTYRIYRKPLAG